MQVARDLGKGEAKLRNFLDRPLKQRVVVGLEMNLAVVLEHLAVELQEIAVRQPALGLPLGRPRVTEVDIDAVDLACIENFGQLVGVDVDEEDVVQLCLRRALHRDDHRVGHLFDRDEQHVGLRRGRLDGEAALAAAELHADLLRLGHQVVPAALALVGVLDLIRPAPLHAGKQVFLFAHSHRMNLVFL